MLNYQGVNVNKDLPGQVEFNRRKNVKQDQQLAVLSSQIQEIISQVPDGFLPRVYYGLTRGPQTYRFVKNTILNIVPMGGNIGDAFEFIDPTEEVDYIPAVGILLANNQIRILIQGDYLENVDSFLLVNMRTGVETTQSFSSPLSLQDASYLGDFSAQDNKNKQITVVKNTEDSQDNVVFASVDFSGDQIYNWVRVGGFRNGIDGNSIQIINDLDITSIDNLEAKDSFIYTGAGTTYKTYLLQTYDLFEIDSQNPLAMHRRGNIKGVKGDTGDKGETGDTGADGATPYIQNNNWYINGEDTGVQALGQDGTDGQDGQAFNIQSGLYSTEENYGQPGNVGPNGETLLELPTLPQGSISGKGYVVYDPLTTPLEPYYDLYWANNGDEEWTIEHPFSGIKGQNGNDGATPYIQDGTWYINGSSTGVSATGPQGPAGPTGPRGVTPKGSWVSANQYFVDDLVTYNGSSYRCIVAHTGITTPPSTDTTRWQLFVAKGDTGATGSPGATGAVPNIAVSATQLAAGSQPTATRSGSNENPIITFGIPKGDTGATGAGVPTGGLSGQFLRKNSSTNYDTSFGSLISGDVTGALGFTPANVLGSNINVLGYQSKLNDMTAPSAGQTIRGQAVVIESYLSSDGHTWYRKWSDGWKECGGLIVEASTSSNRSVTYRYPISFTYAPTVNFNLMRTTTGQQDSMYGWIQAVTKDDFTFSSYFGPSTTNYQWTARGY